MPDSPAPLNDVTPNPQTAGKVLGPFDPHDQERKLQIDAWVRGVVGVAVAGVVLMALLTPRPTDTALLLAPLAVLLGWVGLGVISARVARKLPLLLEQVEANPPRAETELADAMAAWPLARGIRLMLIHRMAVLRHRQGRYPEVAAICSFLLGHKLRKFNRVRPHLLLMLTEAHLAQQHVQPAYPPLLELHDIKQLSLPQQLQRLALQTRYELLAGRPDAALNDLDHKVALAELMPHPQDGMLHAMLAAAAQQAGQPRRADWLNRRAQLLCPPHALAQLATQGLAPASPESQDPPQPTEPLETA